MCMLVTQRPLGLNSSTRLSLWDAAQMQTTPNTLKLKVSTSGFMLILNPVCWSRAKTVKLCWYLAEELYGFGFIS